jgi:hypothetical protein
MTALSIVPVEQLPVNASTAFETSHLRGSERPVSCRPADERPWSERFDLGRAGTRYGWAQELRRRADPDSPPGRKHIQQDQNIFDSNFALALTHKALPAINSIANSPMHYAQQVSITSRTSASGAVRRTALPGPSIRTKRISPASDFLSTRINSR